MRASRMDLLAAMMWRTGDSSEASVVNIEDCPEFISVSLTFLTHEE